MTDVTDVTNVTNVTVTRATREEQPILARLMQLYVYDFSELLGLEVEDDGIFKAPSIESYWDDPLKSAHLIRASDRLAGFALVLRGGRLSGDADAWDMAEFFVMRRHRRAGVGSLAAHQIFATHRGRWEVRQKRENTAAIAFWRRVISDFTSGNFTEANLDDTRWRGPVQSFTTPR